MKDYPLITLNLYIILALVNRMVIQGGGMSLLDRLLQKSLRYKHHRENYIQNLEEKVKKVNPTKKLDSDIENE